MLLAAIGTAAALLLSYHRISFQHPQQRHPACSRPQRYNWMVFNDFHITPSMPDEVAELYGGQKAPCLLFYTQASKEGGKRCMRHPGTAQQVNRAQGTLSAG